MSWRFKRSDFSRSHASSSARAACNSAVSASCCRCSAESRQTVAPQGNSNTDSLADMETLILLPPCSHEVEKGLLGRDTESACTSIRLFPYCTEPPAQPGLCKIAHK